MQKNMDMHRYHIHQALYLVQAMLLKRSLLLSFFLTITSMVEHLHVLQATFDSVFTIKKITTRGWVGHGSYVTSYKIQYGIKYLGIEPGTFYEENGEVKVCIVKASLS